MNAPVSEKVYPLLPLRDIVIFPHMIVPLFVGREKSVKALDKAMNEDRQIILLTQKDPAVDNPKTEEMHTVGTLGTVVQLLRLPDGTVKALVEGQKRVKVKQFSDNADYFEAQVEEFADKLNAKDDINAFMRSLMTQFEEYVRLNKKIPPEILLSIGQIEDPSKLADVIASHLSLKLADRQNLLETQSVFTRLELLFGYMETEMGVLQVEKKIRRRVKKQMEKSQRDYYLNEQMKAIQKELGDEDGSAELDELEAKIRKARMSAEATSKAKAELKKLRHMSPMSSEATVIRNYLDWLLDIPWGKKSAIQTDLKKAEEILNNDHYGLEKVKERILEYLAVQKKTKSVNGPILCLVGPPGVGKTSLARSVARALGRKFVKISLGGVKDESEIRGHRRTYLGSMPGRFIQAMKKAQTMNPVFLIDEIDKMASDYKGDPASAMLEVLDPEQNSVFSDHYIEEPYDLSRVLFIATANYLENIPAALRDRLEIIELSSYTELEKVHIAKEHLLTKQLKENGLKSSQLKIDDEMLLYMIRYYTRESGVRQLERTIATICRKSVLAILKDNKKSIRLTKKLIKEWLGNEKVEYGKRERKNQVGTVTGLAYTSFGGDVLQIEVNKFEGKGKLVLTGQLGDVMKESASIALDYIRANAKKFKISSDVFEKTDIHIHVPEGAVPKDGPSAGVTMTTALVSCLSDTPVRSDVAMTGEVTLRGNVLPIGGLKEKSLAAHRCGISTVIIPKGNVKDLDDIPSPVREAMEFVPVERVTQVLDVALAR